MDLGAARSQVTNVDFRVLAYRMPDEEFQYHPENVFRQT